MAPTFEEAAHTGLAVLKPKGPHFEAAPYNAAMMEPLTPSEHAVVPQANLPDTFGPELCSAIPGPESRALAARLAKVESRNVTALDPVPIFWERASFANLWDVDGNRFVDLTAAFGVANVISVDGGTDACIADGLTIERGKKAISLERQVRIVAGSMVLVGAVLALTVHPYWAALPAFVGAGLVFAGVTDTCGMGMLLMKMPWNR